MGYEEQTQYKPSFEELREKYNNIVTEGYTHMNTILNNPYMNITIRNVTQYKLCEVNRF